MSESGDEIYTVARDGGVFAWEWIADEKPSQGARSNEQGDASDEELAFLHGVGGVSSSSWINFRSQNHTFFFVFLIAIGVAEPLMATMVVT